jgi:hypothetical protein
MDALAGEPVATMSGTASSGKAFSEAALSGNPLSAKAFVGRHLGDGRGSAFRPRGIPPGTAFDAARLPPLGSARPSARPSFTSHRPTCSAIVPADAFPAQLSTRAHVFPDPRQCVYSRAASEPIEPAPMNRTCRSRERLRSGLLASRVDTSRWLRRGASVQVLLCCSMYLTAS